MSTQTLEEQVAKIKAGDSDAALTDAEVLALHNAGLTDPRRMREGTIGHTHQLGIYSAVASLKAEAVEQERATRLALVAKIEALHVRRDDAVYAQDCLEGDCDHPPEDYSGSHLPHDACPKKADAVCAHCADQTEPNEAWEHMIRQAAFWPCETIRLLADDDTTALDAERAKAAREALWEYADLAESREAYLKARVKPSALDGREGGTWNVVKYELRARADRLGDTDGAGQ